MFFERGQGGRRRPPFGASPSANEPSERAGAPWGARGSSHDAHDTIRELAARLDATAFRERQQRSELLANMSQQAGHVSQNSLDVFREGAHREDNITALRRRAKTVDSEHGALD